jgi:hypothetical protein
MFRHLHPLSGLLKDLLFRQMQSLVSFLAQLSVATLHPPPLHVTEYFQKREDQRPPAKIVYTF